MVHFFGDTYVGGYFVIDAHDYFCSDECCEGFALLGCVLIAFFRIML